MGRRKVEVVGSGKREESRWWEAEGNERRLNADGEACRRNVSL
jgi:hypothetical protein